MVRFWTKVDRSESAGSCWTWMAARSDRGYGIFWFKGRQDRAHRVSWELANRRPPNGVVRHSCDNPSCVRPDHLLDGTNLDNVRDRDARRRTAIGNRNGSRTKPERRAWGDRNGSRTMPSRRPRGEQHAFAKVTEAVVREIRARYASGGVSQQALADELGVTQATCSRIILRQTWRHVT